VRSRTIQEQ
jgi:hypothetical protein